jgi:hypothetical protein
MKHTAIVIVAGLAFAATLAAAPALAQPAKRTFVSAIGSDANICTVISAPCRTFGAAYALTIADGEISVLDPAGYGTLTITHGLSIQGRGWASITAQSGNAITITAGPGDKIYLQGLLLDGAGTGANGIAFNAGQSLTIGDCAIRHFATDGIRFAPNATSNLAVSSTLADDNGDGIIVSPSGSGTVTAVFNRVETNNNTGIGITLDGEFSVGTVKATVSDSVAGGNSAGFVAFSFPGHALPTLMLFHSLAANNNVGIQASGTGVTIRAAQSMLTGNANGWEAFSGGVVQSYADNYIDGNGGNETAPPSTAKK